MKRIAILCAAIVAAAASSVSAGDGWVSLFDGKSLDGWIQKNGTATYRIEGDAIVGKTNEGSPNSFLCTEKLYGDFELTFDVKVDNSLNSGVQIRSQTAEPKGDAKFGRVNGPQVEIEASGANGAEAGYVYGEATGRGWLTKQDELKPHKHFKDGEWNSYRILAVGPRIQTWINGVLIADYKDEPTVKETKKKVDGKIVIRKETVGPIYETHSKGFIGLQVHGIKKGTGPYEVAWRNLKIRNVK